MSKKHIPSKQQTRQANVSNTQKDDAVKFARPEQCLKFVSVTWFGVNEVVGLGSNVCMV